MCLKQIYDWFSKKDSTNQEQPQAQSQEEQPQEQPQEQSQEQPQLQRITMAATTTFSRLPTIRFGDSGDSVRILQRLLTSNGYPVRIDGFFGALTETAVRAFQSRRGLRTDGIVGSRTWRELA